jgi:hypothetical protein|tara:strand:+ start:1748 stop:2005 length:258 start_codon:yes stop_codon:yes gene_type:complete
MAIGRMAKYNDVGAGGKPILGNTSMLSNGPARPGGSQKATVGLGKDKAHRGDKAAGTRPRSTPENQHGKTGKVEPASKQPNSAVR